MAIMTHFIKISFFSQEIKNSGIMRSGGTSPTSPNGVDRTQNRKTKKSRETHNERGTVRIGTLNMKGISSRKKKCYLPGEMCFHDIPILAVQETKNLKATFFELGGTCFYLLPSKNTNGSRCGGTGFIVREGYRPYVSQEHLKMKSNPDSWNEETRPTTYMATFV